MSHQLVIQFRGDSLEDFDAMIALEDRLIDALSGVAEVDGHDCGSGETNIFILTSDPETAFERARPVLEQMHLISVARVAYRPLAAEYFTTIWPAGSNQDFVVA